MCDPVTIGITLASQLGSAYLQKKAASAVDKKRAGVIARTEQALKKNRDSAAQSFQQSLESATPEKLKESTEQATQKRSDAYVENIKQDDILPAAASGSDAAQRAIVKALGDAVTNSSAEAKRRAAVDSYNDALFGRNTQFTRSKQNIGQQANFAQGTTGVSELELEAANSAGSKYANLAGIVSALGTVAGGARGFGAGKGWWGGYDPKTGITWNSGRVG